MPSLLLAYQGVLSTKLGVVGGEVRTP